MKKSSSASRPYSASASQQKSRPPWNIGQYSHKSLRFDVSREEASQDATKRPKSASVRATKSRPSSAVSQSHSPHVTIATSVTSDINASNPTTPKSLPRPKSATAASKTAPKTPLFVDTSCLASTPIVSTTSSPNPSPLLHRMSMQLYADLAADIAMTYHTTHSTAMRHEKVSAKHKQKKSATSPVHSEAVAESTTSKLFASYAPPVTVRTRYVAPVNYDTSEHGVCDAWMNPQTMSAWPHNYKFTLCDTEVISPPTPELPDEDPITPLRLIPKTKSHELLPPESLPFRVAIREEYRRKYGSVSAGLLRDDPEKLSPRSSVLRESILRHQLPIPIAEILLSDTITSLEIPNMGLGDEKMLCLVAALPYLTHITTIDISGNRLTDASIQPFLTEMLKTQQCHSLDVSDNKIDSDSIDMLKANLRSKDCCLQRLILRKSDVDDSECADMMDAILRNHTLKCVDLSHNQIGMKEDLNAARPSFVTGGEAIAEMLVCNGSLTELNVAWNNIRGESAVTLGQSIAQNNTLMILNLAYNNIGDTGAQHLAHSLRFNVSLTSLDISYNNLSPKSALVFGQVLEGNTSMTYCNFNGNCVGRIGSTALVRAMRVAASSQRVLQIQLDDANLQYIDRLTFDRNNCTGSYELDLSDPYGYAVACILYEIADSKPNAVFRKITHGVESNNGGMRWRPVQLIRGPSESDIQQSVNENLVKVICEQSDVKAIQASITIEDNSNLLQTAHGNHMILSHEAATASISRSRRGSMLAKPTSFSRAILANLNKKKADRQLLEVSLKTLCGRFNMHLDAKFAELLSDELYITPPIKKCTLSDILEIIFNKAFTLESKQAAELDVTGVLNVLARIGLNKIATEDDVRQYYRTLATKIMMGNDIFGLKLIEKADFVRFMMLYFTDNLSSAPGRLVDADTGFAWEIPTEGILSVDFYCSKMPPSADGLINTSTIKRLSQAIPHTSAVKSDTYRKNLIEIAAKDEDFVLNCDQAEVMLEEFRDQRSTISHTIENLLHQISSPWDACRLITENLTFDKRRMGTAFRIITGNSSGFYSLDLSKEDDRACGKMLAQQSNLERSKRGACGHIDTSQYGDDEYFRNETLNGRPFRLSTNYFLDMPQTGKIRFDYVNVARPIPGAPPISDAKLKCILDNIIFAKAPQTEESEAMKFLISSAEIRNSSKDGRRVRSATQMQNHFQYLKKAEGSVTSALALRGEMQLETNRILWSDEIQSSYSRYVECYSDYLNDKIRLAKQQILEKKGQTFTLEDRPTTPPPDTSDALLVANQQKALHLQAVYSLLFREAKLKPIQSAIVFHSGPKADPKSVRRSSIELHADSNKYTVDRCFRFEVHLQYLQAVLLYNLYFTVAQVKVILMRFHSLGAPLGVLVRCLCLVFNRILNLEHLGSMLDSFNVALKFEAFHRLGILNVFSPLHPDGSYRLDLACWEHRETAKILIRLAVLEPGENWRDEYYHPSVVEPPVPGWKLPLSWAEDSEEDGLRKVGLLVLKYVCEEGANYRERGVLNRLKCLSGTFGKYIDGITPTAKQKLQFEAKRIMSDSLRKMTSRRDTYDRFSSRTKSSDVLAGVDEIDFDDL